MDFIMPAQTIALIHHLMSVEGFKKFLSLAVVSIHSPYIMYILTYENRKMYVFLIAVKYNITIHLPYIPAMMCNDKLSIFSIFPSDSYSHVIFDLICFHVGSWPPVMLIPRSKHLGEQN